MLVIKTNSQKKTWLLLFSYGFYMFWNPAFIFLLLGTTLFNFYFGNVISKSVSKKKWLVISIIANLSLLAYFKYYHFLEDNLYLILRFLGHAPSWTSLNVLLPIGISFYTFEVISYNVDIYKGETKPAVNLIDFALFLAFFPRLVAGPILRPNDFISQLKEKKDLSYEPKHLLLFVKGLFKKVIIADNLSTFSDVILNSPENYPSMVIWVAVLCFTAQIYCDFSGYSDMAIALAGFLGYHFPINFNRPYFAISPSDFWTKWHISLSSWLKDYLYIPLGGNRCSAFKTYRNLMLTMLLGGLWHGASWNFVVWGGLHGFILVVYRIFSLDKKIQKLTNPFLWVIAWFTFQYFVWITWISFRITDFAKMLIAMKKFVIFDFNFQIKDMGLGRLNFFSTILFLLCFMFLHYFSYKLNGFENYTNKISKTAQTISLFILGMIFFYLWPSRESPFIYFQF
jgi:alginate O-acetyltransferase complex protein AlgI